nr:reverse transcriptase domain-containing protein [Tanacetum cinerariifolium]
MQRQLWSPPILVGQFELKHSLINMMTSDQFIGLEKENPHEHIRWAARRWLEKEPSRFILTWEDLVSKFINEFFSPSRMTNLRNEISNFQQQFDESFHEAWDRYKDLLCACHNHDFTKLHQLDTFYNAINQADQDSLNSAAGGNLLERCTQDVLTIIENKSKDNIQGYVSAAAITYNQGNSGYHPPALMQQNHVVPLSELEKIKKMNEINMKAMQTQINNVKNELRNEMKTLIQASMSNQTNKLKNMMASFFQMNTTSTSGSGPVPSNTIANREGKLKAITTRSGIVLDGPSVPMPHPFINLEEDKCVEETLTDQELAEYTIKVPPPLVQKPKPPSQRNYMVHQRDPLHLNIPYLSRMHKQKQQEKDEVQIHKFWQMFKQLHINITLTDALILIPKYQKMLKALLSNKEKLLELANTPLNENCSAIILKKLPEKLGDPGKFLISYGFNKLKCKALADLARIARDVFVLVSKFTFLADFVIVEYDIDPQVLLILARLFLRIAHALIDVHGEEMILREGDERLTLNMRHDTSSYLNQPQKESINMTNIYDDSCEDFLEDLFVTNHLSGNPTSSSHTNLTSPKVKDDIFEPEGDMEMDPILEDSIDEDNLADPNGNLFDTIPEMFTDEHALNYSSPPLYDDYDDDLDEFKSDNDDAYNDPFYSKGGKIKESKLLIDELDLPRSRDFFLLSNKNVKKIAISHASLILKDFIPPLHELPFYKEVPGSETLLSFSFKNEEKVLKPGILTSKGVHSSLLSELSHRGPKAFKVIKKFKSPLEVFPCSFGEDIRILDVPYLHFYPS